MSANGPLTIHGRYFWKDDERVRDLRQCNHCYMANKHKFLVRGVVYQPSEQPMPNGPIDPIADDRLDRLKHDIALFKDLGINTIFVCKSAGCQYTWW